MIRTAWTFVVAGFAVLTCAGGVIIAGLIGVKDREGGVYDTLQRTWARLIVWAAGVKIVLHGHEHLSAGQLIIVGNHVSWFDVFCVAAAIPRCRFVAKAEVRRIPLVGAAAAAAGHVYIERENRKAALEQYKGAAARIHHGSNVVVFAEGTRGSEYALRPFKKGPFVLAVSAEAPIVPMLIHGTIETMARGSFRVRAGTVHVHFMEPIPTRGMNYDDRDRLAMQTRNAIAALLEREYGVTSPSWEPRGAIATAPPTSSS
jgi:1-acyl-sn-glycerol-3-phosphate acyltransferase